MSRAGLAGLSQQDGGGRPGWGLSCTTLPQVLPPRLITAGRRLLRGAGGIPTVVRITSFHRFRAGTHTDAKGARQQGKRSLNTDSSLRRDGWSIGLSSLKDRREGAEDGHAAATGPAKSGPAAPLPGSRGREPASPHPVRSLRWILDFKGHWPRMPTWPACQLQCGGPHIWPRVRLKILQGERVFW